ncbi:hypothetical protein FSOLCH5_003654 [Fusarium solani]|nr:hypothetical protein MRS44_013243 [Fusarium solani]KAJ4175740.1 hypothetical protein NW767_015682 [Fusarium falciforme]KAJ4184408.1 hypothetical protein NW759_017031 [Fusarium solani]
MKFTITLMAAFASIAAAASKECTPGTYACTSDAKGWQVCDVSGKFVLAGSCPPSTSCKFFQASKSPYCVPPDFKFP